jgi:hypothetical protein
MAAQITAESRSVIDRAMRMEGRHIGSERKRSMSPVLRSVLSPTAVPLDEVTRFMASRPASAKSV